MSNTSEFFLNEKPVRAAIIILQSDGGVNCTDISKSIDSTYSHTVKIIQRMAELDLVTSEKVGRNKIVKLSDTGKKQARLYLSLMEIYEGKNKPTGGNIADSEIFS